MASSGNKPYSFSGVLVSGLLMAMVGAFAAFGVMYAGTSGYYIAQSQYKPVIIEYK